MRILLHYGRPELFEDLVRARFPDAEILCCDSYAAMPEAVAAFRPEVVFLLKFENRPYPREAVVNGSSVRWVCNGGVGIDHLRPWDPDRLTVTNSAGVASDVMAHYVIGGIIAFAMRFPYFLRLQGRRQWSTEEVIPLNGRTVCVLGLGATGRAVARMASAIGLRVVGTRASAQETPYVERVYGLDRTHEALAGADYVVVAVPLVESTRHLVDARALAAMREGAFLIDVSRGGVVDPDALIDALESGRLAGALLDVFETEPMPAECPLWHMDDVIITSHSSSVFPGWERAAAEMFCDNLERWQRGEPLVNVVDPVRGY